jgi:predicted NBD/HSP70 family sugar kinase
MESPNIGNAELIAQVNRRLVLQAVRSLQPTYRAEVSRWTNLNPATVTGITSDLLKSRLLREVSGDVPAPGPTGGRPPTMLELNNDARRFLAIDLEPELVRIAIVGLGINISDYHEEVLDRHSQPSTVINTIVSLCENMLGRGRRKKIHGIGLSLPGLIDREQGILISSTNLPKWRNVPIRDMLTERLGQEPKLERSFHLAAMHEDWTDRSSQNNIKLVLSLRTGIGMSIVRQGQVYQGAGGFDGEVGHTVIDLNGEICECGNRGCLETFVSADAVRKRVEQKLRKGRCRSVAAAIAEGESLRPELVYRLAKEGDEDCTEIVRDVGRYVGLAAANLVNLLAPDTLIVCGSIDVADEIILDAIRSQIAERSLPQLRGHLTVKLAFAKEKASLLGAAVLVARELFDLPRLAHPQVTL